MFRWLACVGGDCFDQITDGVCPANFGWAQFLDLVISMSNGVVYIGIGDCRDDFDLGAWCFFLYGGVPCAASSDVFFSTYSFRWGVRSCLWLSWAEQTFDCWTSSIEVSFS